MSEKTEKGDVDCTSSNINLNLDLSPPVLEKLIITTPTNSSTSSPTSSCVSSDKKCPVTDSSSNHEETTTLISDMVLVGCRKCLLYVLLVTDYLICLQCKGFDYIHIPDCTESNKKSRKN
ncbi:hypothetical protein MKX03_027099 [Papaver bracteatum]|nr:hypothetical protein MKX03_027099 [Papaver bracteatum]